MLETVREFGLSELRSPSTGEPDVDEATLMRRHRDFHVDLAERFHSDWFGPRQRRWSEHMRTVLPDLRAAFMLCLTVEGDSAVGQRLAGALFYFWYGCGELREGLHWLERVIAGDPTPSRHRMRALAAHGRVLNLLGRPAEAIHPAMECLRYLRDNDDAYYESHALQTLGLAQMYTGEPSALTTLRAAAMRAAELPPAHPARALTLVGLGIGVLFDGDPVRASELLGEAAAICRQHGEVWWHGHALGIAVLPLLTIGDVGRATEHALDCLRSKIELRDTFGMMLSVQVFAWVHVQAGDFARAARLLGASERHLRTAGGSPMRFGTWLQAQHDGEAACREALGDEEYDAEVKRGMELSINEAVDSILGDGRAPDATVGRPAPVGDPVRLTRREREIAVLIAQGLSNRQIAHSLVISQRTVESHVGNILTKFGFSSRAQIAASFAGGATLRAPE
jgi:DNA-binding CsgD family transcriptional regulator/tetratricopeptide (TPR) repeat protein